MIAAINMQWQNHIHRRRNKYNHVQPTSNQHRRCLGCDLGPRDPRESFERKHVVIVMDAMKEFSVETLEWVLKNIALDTCCSITLFGVKPWLTFALSCKTETDIWTMNIEDLLSMRDTNEWRNDPRYQKAQGLVELCLKYQVKPHIESGQGCPKRLLVLEKAAYATWVVFDRHHNKKHIEYVAKKVPCNILVMNNNGEADMLPRKSVFSTTFESNDEIPAIFMSSTIPTPKLMLSDEYKRKLNLRSP